MTEFLKILKMKTKDKTTLFYSLNSKTPPVCQKTNTCYFQPAFSLKSTTMSHEPHDAAHLRSHLTNKLKTSWAGLHQTDTRQVRKLSHTMPIAETTGSEEGDVVHGSLPHTLVRNGKLYKGMPTLGDRGCGISNCEHRFSYTSPLLFI